MWYQLVWYRWATQGNEHRTADTTGTLTPHAATGIGSHSNIGLPAGSGRLLEEVGSAAVGSGQCWKRWAGDRRSREISADTERTQYCITARSRTTEANFGRRHF
eukprot:CAMPEP_0174708054 /NCGR_PEP_ID=MMETSP1094-20130205/10405_1 /TAXON_ID=156173 /ORGANISM="Chrysochromulina brevifilum, Strain UTEX LB 985" /LENGTH=103 /DNA_ID=CAMNT_0015906547 /DNA_START=746 /DNA_END=1057 /DNA_ORIENTATION=-